MFKSILLIANLSLMAWCSISHAAQSSSQPDVIEADTMQLFLTSFTEDSSNDYANLFVSPEAVNNVSLQELYKIALANNPNLAQAKANLVAAQARIEESEANFWPSVSAGIGVNQTLNGR